MVKSLDWIAQFLTEESADSSHLLRLVHMKKSGFTYRFTLFKPRDIYIYIYVYIYIYNLFSK